MKVLAFIILLMLPGEPPKIVKQEVSGLEECAQFVRDFMMRADFSKIGKIQGYQVGCQVENPVNRQDVEEKTSD